METEYKKGDQYICIPGFRTGGDDAPDGGGSGYIEGKIITVDHATWGHKRKGPDGEDLAIVWPIGDSKGIWSCALRKYPLSADELKEYLNYDINEGKTSYFPKIQ